VTGAFEIDALFLEADGEPGKLPSSGPQEGDVGDPHDG
jgi:hypothetical protein